MAERISATPAAITLIEQLTQQHGPIVFLQSGGCCEGSGPMCLPAVEFRPSPSDVKLGTLAGAVFYMGDSHFSFMQNTHTILDAVPGSSGSFSLDCGSGLAFITRGRVYTDEELASLPPEERVGYL
ncbi:hypothetical protein SAMN05192566_2677 [Methylophilus rhizosphaerae]|uniref:Acetaldehyde dehydrogenase n=1 Tax=Methylophilus rhizosphaerae TaxID=492660 RepID=A0A1G9FB05_9PROT|nr:DUF779 domain-containing protein [Methylophilus rhizosphaerae]SDK85423.1 hypothetical protein SAMN05192566_2677 [Methylophilus rhizosphaerae]